MAGMSTHCPYRHIHPATWRLRAIRLPRQPATVSRTSQLLSSTGPNPTHAQQRRGYSDEATFRPWRGWKKDGSHGKATEFQDGPEQRKPFRLPRSLKREPNPFAGLEIENLHNLATDVQKLAKAARDEPQSSKSPPTNLTFHATKSPLVRRYAAKLTKRRPSALEKVNLRNNPWAQMLSSPVRPCPHSSSRLPGALLTDFNLVKAPNNDIYLMPDKLADLDELDREMGGNRLAKSQPQANASQLSSNKQMALAKHSSQKDRVVPGPPEGPPLRHLMPTLRMLTNINFMRFVTYTLGEKSPKKPNAAGHSSTYKALRLFSPSSRGKMNAALHYERNQVEFGLATGTIQEAPRREDMFDVSQLQWQPDIPQRLTRIIQQRVLVALSNLAGKMSTKEPKLWAGALKAMPIPRKTGHFEFGEFGIIELPKKDLDQVHLDFEKAGIAVEHVTDQDQDPSQTSIPAESPSEDLDEDEDSQECDVTMPKRWLAGSIFIHVGKSDIEQLLPTASTHANARPLPSYLQNSLIPPMIPIEDKYRLPVFSLHRLLNPEGDKSPDDLPDSTKQDLEMLAQIINSCRAMHLRGPASSAKVVYSPLPGSPPVDDVYQDYLILVKAKFNQNLGLITEIWRLWRYLAGRNMGALPKSDKNDG